MYFYTKLKIWRVANSVLLVAGMLLPWYELLPMDEAGDIFPGPAGWKAVHNDMIWALEEIKTSPIKFDVYQFTMILTGAGAVLVLLYLAYNVLAIIQNRNVQSKLLSFLFIRADILFLYESMGSLTRPIAGFWVISLGLLSSAVLEWVNARSADTQPVE